MHRVILSDIVPSQAMWLKDQLIQDGLIMHGDFEWEYHPPLWDGFTNERPKHVVFCFKSASLATFYQLKWSK